MKKNVKVMGIVNINDDSFYSESRAKSRDEILERMAKHIEEGADIIDIGACSTRPGSLYCSAEEEWARLKPAIKLYRELFFTTPLSVDTFRASVVQRCFDEIGPFMVNDISSGENDKRMLQLVGKLNLSFVAMHKRGNPDTMQSLCQYDDVTEEVITYFKEFDIKAQYTGVESWILDPGFGFAKDIAQNYEMIERFEEFHTLGHEVLAGISRKSFIFKPLGLTAAEALPATTELHKKLIQKGADILRVHDVAPAKALC